MTSETFSPKTPRLTTIFSDIDGTIVHYDAKLKKQGYELVKIVEDEEKKSSNKQYDTRIHIWRHIETNSLIETIPVPSATLGGGFISTKTLKLVKEMREKHGVNYVLITGARTSTFLSRVESRSLPEFDFGVCEGGGKIFSFSSTFVGDDRCCDKVELDLAWLDSFSPSIGTCWKQHLLSDSLQQHDQDKTTNTSQNNIFNSSPHCSDSNIAPEDRFGAPLWELYRMLKTEKDLLGEGFGFPKLDAKSFDTAFMVDVRGPTANSSEKNETPGTTSAAATSVLKANVDGVSEVTPAELNLKNLVASSKFADSLEICFNLGKAHISANGCTKADVVKYLAEKKLKFQSRETGEKQKIELFSSENNKDSVDSYIVAGMFDDENDLEFVKLCHVGFAPGVAHPAVNQFFENHEREFTDDNKTKKRYQKCKYEGLLGTENALEYLLKNYCL